MLYWAMFAETLRLYKATTKFQDFITFAKILIGRDHKIRGSDKQHEKALFKVFNSHEEYFVEFWKNDDYVLINFQIVTCI